MAATAGQLRQKKVVSQETFPGAYIEPEWSRLDAIENVPYYSLRLLLGAGIYFLPNDEKDYVSMHHEGMEYVLHRKNYELVASYAKQTIDSYLLPNGYPCDAKIAPTIRHNPNLLLDLHRFMARRIKYTMDIPLDVARVFWIKPDHSGCGHFRSDEPSKYMIEGDFSHKSDFYSEQNMLVTYNALNYFDAVVVHRAPNPAILHFLKSMKRENKILVYETDDDLFDVPSFNVASQWIDDDMKRRTAEAIQLSDVCITTTDHLKAKIGRMVNPDRVFVCPNLIDTKLYKPIKNTTRELDPEFLGLHIQQLDEDNVALVDSQGTTKRIVSSNSKTWNYEPIRILWVGSNTHDDDLNQIVNPVKRIMAKYGMAVRFIFMGYLPTEFAESAVDQGNTNHRLVVKDEYVSSVDYISGVPFARYNEVLNMIEPDFAICPLTDHEFNNSKSNIKPLEMGALCVPSVVSDFGPYKFVKNRFDGLKVSVGDEDGWFDAIELLVTTPELRAKLGRNMHERVNSEFSWHTNSPNRGKWDMFFGVLKVMIDAAKAETTKVLDMQADQHPKAITAETV